MAITLKRQLNDNEKQRILEIHGRNCFATGHPIAVDETVQFDHIRAYADGGASELDNIAPMCEIHNKAKGTMPLGDFRVKLRLDAFFQGGDSLTLKNLLEYLKKSRDITAYGQPVIVIPEDSVVRIEYGTSQQTHALYQCPTTGWKYFYATLPVEVLDSDDDQEQSIGLQPRYLIEEKVFELYRHFQRHPVLQPSIGRIAHDRVLLFDGQHKAAALLWTGRRVFECKIYLSPDLMLLNRTNIAAHDKFSQTRFYSSIMVMKLGSEFGAEFEKYKNLEDGEIKSEAGFMKFLDATQAMTKADSHRRFRSYLYNSVLEAEDNRIGPLISASNRSTDEKPLTIDMLSKSIFACFLYTEPVEDNMTTDAYKRDKEVSNVVALLNMLYDLGLAGWNPKAGLNDENQRRLNRLFRSKSIMAWSELLRDAVCGKLELQDVEERARPFYRDLSDSDLTRIKSIVARLFSWKFWNAPVTDDIDRILADNKSAVKAWFRNHGLTTGYLMGAQE